MHRSHLVRALALIVALGASACGGEPPVRHPVSTVQERVRPRIALIEFVVKDPARRAKVEALHLEIEALTFEWQRERLALRDRMLAPRARGETAGLEALFAEQRAANAAFFQRYAALQLALRASLTPDEFARLDGIK